MNGQRYAVIFDMDGVLVDTEPIYFSVNRRNLAALGVDPAAVDLTVYVGSAADRMWRELKERFALSLDVNELAAREREGFFEALQLEKLRPIPGIPELLADLERLGISRGLASSSSRRNMDLILEKSGLAARLELRVSGEDVERGKPAPDIFLRAAEQLGVSPENCLVIEDSPLGVAGANEAGMLSVGFCNPSSGHQDLSAACLQVTHLGAAARREIVAALAHRAWRSGDDSLLKDSLRLSPQGEGRLTCLVRRPARGRREELTAAELDPVRGLIGDRWFQSEGESAPDRQLTLINTRAITALAGSAEKALLCGDQLHVDFDISTANLCPGDRLAVGEAVLEISAAPHLGCRDFVAWYGDAANQLVNSSSGISLKLRGVNARILRGGLIRPGDPVRRLPA